jgi:predicted double-glycine peptidase
MALNGQTHIVVIAGINGLNVKVYDPSPKNVGGVDWRSLQTWYEGSDVDSRDISDGVQAVFLYCP